MDCPFQPSVMIVAKSTWEANDPLVHYTVEDVTPPTFVNSITKYNPTTQATLPLTDTLGALSLRYEPWPGTGGAVGPNVLYKDPQITRSDDWQFPTNKLPNVGWIGRVHRGTPWQTIYLKADPDPVNNPAKWATKWVSDPLAVTYPTNDWQLLDLFTTAPNDNALRGALSVNQTNSAAWHALLDGVIVWSNNSALKTTVGFPINPTAPFSDLVSNYPNAVAYMMDGPPDQNNLAVGLNGARTNQPNGVFHRTGDILQAQALTVLSPYLDVSKELPRDEIVERIPQQIGSLLKVGQPQFVIYAWGQTLRPKDLYNAPNASLFKLCTNYSITGEFLTRTVCHLDMTKSDRGGQNPKIQIDSFNILPAAQ